jgi:hypothetical protein
MASTVDSSRSGSFSDAPARAGASAPARTQPANRNIIGNVCFIENRAAAGSDVRLFIQSNNISRTTGRVQTARPCERLRAATTNLLISSISLEMAVTERFRAKLLSREVRGRALAGAGPPASPSGTRPLPSSQYPLSNQNCSLPAVAFGRRTDPAEVRVRRHI